MRPKASAADCRATFEAVLVGRDQAAKKAWDALGGYKFWMFGYHAAAWVKYNQLLPHLHSGPNPFRQLVKLAREVRSGAQKEGSG